MGGKAASLHRLAGASLPVPRWFCLGHDVHAGLVATGFPEASERLQRAAGGGAEALAALHAEARERLATAPLPADLLEAFAAELEALKGDFFAVRSSAAGEDGARDSYAGQFDSYLCVPRAEVLERVRDCWASAFNPRALAYLLARHHAPAIPALGVVIQEMVDSQAAGVMFLANPTGSLTETVITAALGLGEGAVADRVETDTYTLDRSTGRLTETVARKTGQMVREASGGTHRAEVPAEQAEQPVLSTEQIHRLAELGERVGALYEHPQDIEWALDAAGNFHVTQSRPITTVLWGRETLFDNSNIVESYPGVTLPLTFSFIQQAYAAVFDRAARLLGVPRQVLSENALAATNLLGYLRGRVYYNLTHFYRAFELIPGLERQVAVWERSLGIRVHRPVLAQRGPLAQALGMAATGARLLWNLFTVGPRMRALRRGLEQTAAGLRREVLERLDNHALVAAFATASRSLFPRWGITLVNDLYAFLFTHLATRLLARAGAPEPQALFNGLLCGRKGVESVEPLRHLLALAVMVREQTELRRHLAERVERAVPGEDLVAELAARRDFSAFAAALEAHLERFGTRCLEELKLETRTFREDPAALCRLVLRYAAGELSAEQVHSREQAALAAAEQELSALYRGRPLGRLVFEAARWLAGRSIAFRESSRLDRARAYGVVRALFSTLGRNLAREGALADERDVFYLTVDEVCGHVLGGSINTALLPIIERRKQELAEHVQPAPAERVVTRGSVLGNRLPHRQGPTALPREGLTLRGTACASGQVTAEAVIIREQHRAQDTAGKILVAEMTDPGWVFLMVPAAGLVVEKGSILSHTAIIGRELGIPTIVGVAGATTHIPAGARVHLDGQAGLVTVLPDS